MAENKAATFEASLVPIERLDTEFVRLLTRFDRKSRGFDRELSCDVPTYPLVVAIKPSLVRLNPRVLRMKPSVVRIKAPILRTNSFLVPTKPAVMRDIRGFVRVQSALMPELSSVVRLITSLVQTIRHVEPTYPSSMRTPSSVVPMKPSFVRRCPRLLLHRRGVNREDGRAGDVEVKFLPVSPFIQTRRSSPRGRCATGQHAHREALTPFAVRFEGT